jgi:hypothetical protein
MTAPKCPKPISAGKLLAMPDEPPLMCRCGHYEGVHEAQHCCMCRCEHFTRSTTGKKP